MSRKMGNFSYKSSMTLMMKKGIDHTLLLDYSVVALLGGYGDRKIVESEEQADHVCFT
jgi:hypothetical protein